MNGSRGKFGCHFILLKSRYNCFLSVFVVNHISVLFGFGNFGKQNPKEMNHKHFISAIMLAMSACGFSSYAAITGVKVTDGTESVTFQFENRPTVNFTSEKIVVADAHNSVEFPVTSAVKFEFVDSDSAVDNISEDNLKISFTSGGIEIQGLVAGSDVYVYDISGILLAHSYAGTDGDCFVSTERLPQGCLIVKTSSRTYKILNRL